MGDVVRRRQGAGEHSVTVFTLRDGGHSAWCSCGDRFDSTSRPLTVAWARAHGPVVQHYGAPESSPAA